MKTYKAPWCKGLIIMSALATALCLGVTFGVPLLPQPKNGGEFGRWLAWLPLALVVICPLFIVRGYTITMDAILIHRPAWDTRLPRTGLRSAVADPSAMCKSLRTCGNGGFFSVTGFYWSKSLGAYRAFVTDPRKAVVLRYERRTVVISPDAPEDFVRELALPE
jgi:hypothetical protein